MLPVPACTFSLNVSTMFDVFETSEEDLKRFADNGSIERAIPRCPTEDRDTVLRWLDKYAEIGQRIGAI